MPTISPALRVCPATGGAVDVGEDVMPGVPDFELDVVHGVEVPEAVEELEAEGGIANSWVSRLLFPLINESSQTYDVTQMYFRRNQCQGNSVAF